MIKKPINPLQDKMNKADYDDMKYHQEQDHAAMKRAKGGRLLTTSVIMKKRGDNYFGLCPYHKESTPSFSFSPKRNIYKCFGCGKSGGDHLSFDNGILRLKNENI